MIDYEKVGQIFRPYYYKKLQEVESNKFKFVQYTNASAAMSILQKEEVWMRNTNCMNDHSEIQFGINLLENLIGQKEIFEPLNKSLNMLCDGVFSGVLELLEAYLPHFRRSTYITCISEHPADEDEYGRLSMWRAYGKGAYPVALVVNTDAFVDQNDLLNTFTEPVMYEGEDYFKEYLTHLPDNIIENIDVLCELNPETLKNILFQVFQNIAICTKHPGFREEREWRVIYNPITNKSEYINHDWKDLNGIPQQIQKFQVKDVEGLQSHGITLKSLLHKIIIGPNDNPLFLWDSFVDILDELGFENPSKMVTFSNLPLRA